MHEIVNTAMQGMTEEATNNIGIKQNEQNGHVLYKFKQVPW